MNRNVTRWMLFLLLSTCAIGQQLNSGYASKTLNGADGPPFPILTNLRTSLPINFTYLGAVNQPYVLYQASTLSVGSAFIPSNVSPNSVDLTLNPFPTKVLDGFMNPIFSTDATGVGGFTVIAPPAGNPPNGIPLGFQLALQSLIADPFSTLTVTLTAATRITITQGPTITNLSPGDDGSIAVTVPSSMPLPFYGSNYTTLHVNGNGFISFGSSILDFTPSDSEFISNPPRLAAFWTDMNQQSGGTVTATVDTPQNGNPGYARVDFVNVQGFTIAVNHNFSMLLRTDGYIEMIYPTTQNASLFDQITGISPGQSTFPQVQRNFVGPLPLGTHPLGDGILTTPPYVRFGAVNEAFFEWFGIYGPGMPSYPYSNYDNPYDLYNRIVRFNPNATGALPAASLGYTMF